MSRHPAGLAALVTVAAVALLLGAGQLQRWRAASTTDRTDHDARPDGDARPGVTDATARADDHGAQDPTLQRLLEQAQTQCVLTQPRAAPRGCPELRALIDERVRALGARALPTLLWSLEHAQPPMRRLGAWTLHANLDAQTLDALADASARQDQTPLDPALVTALLRALARQQRPDEPGSLWAEQAVHLAWIADLGQPLARALDAIQDEDTRANATRGLMRYGRTRALPMVQRAADLPSLVLKRAALEAPLRMTRWSDHERALLCPWLKPWLGHEDDPLSERAARAMRRCGGPWHDALLDELERRVTLATYAPPFAFAVRDALADDSLPDPPDLAQRERARALLERAARSSALAARSRAFALACLTQLWPDARTQALLDATLPDEDDALAQERASLRHALQLTRQLLTTTSPSPTTSP